MVTPKGWLRDAPAKKMPEDAQRLPKWRPSLHRDAQRRTKWRPKDAPYIMMPIDLIYYKSLFILN